MVHLNCEKSLTMFQAYEEFDNFLSIGLTQCLKENLEVIRSLDNEEKTPSLLNFMISEAFSKYLFGILEDCAEFNKYFSPNISKTFQVK